MVSFTAGLSSQFIQQNTQAPVPSLYQKQEKSLVENTSDRIMTIVGQLEINASLSVVEIKGKAYLDLQDTNKKASATLSFCNYAVKETVKLDTSKIKPVDINVVDFSNFTHMVTDVCLGKFLYGDISLTSKTDKYDLKAGGELSVTLMKIPIGGTGKVDFNKSEVDTNYNFNASLQAKGHNFDSGLLNAPDITTFLQSVDAFVTSTSSKDNTSIVKVFMTPLTAIKGLTTYQPLVCTTLIANSAKKTILDGRDLIQYIQVALIPYVVERQKFDLLTLASDLRTKALKSIMDIEYALNNCKTNKEVLALNTLCQSAMYYTVQLWKAIPEYTQLSSFVAALNLPAVPTSFIFINVYFNFCHYFISKHQAFRPEDTASKPADIVRGISPRGGNCRPGMVMRQISGVMYHPGWQCIQQMLEVVEEDGVPIGRSYLALVQEHTASKPADIVRGISPRGGNCRPGVVMRQMKGMVGHPGWQCIQQMLKVVEENGVPIGRSNLALVQEHTASKPVDIARGISPRGGNCRPGMVMRQISGVMYHPGWQCIQQMLLMVEEDGVPIGSFKDWVIKSGYKWIENKF
jgi:hypothetical protein